MMQVMGVGKIGYREGVKERNEEDKYYVTLVIKIPAFNIIVVYTNNIYTYLKMKCITAMRTTP